MNNKITFHIQRAAKSKYLKRLVTFFSGEDLFDTAFILSTLITDGYEIDKNSISRSLTLGTKLGLFEKKHKNSYQLTQLGISCRKLANYREDVYNDLVHYLFYSAWTVNGNVNYWSWSYMKICEFYWRNCPKIEPKTKVFGRLMAEASYYFPDLKPAAGTETVDKVEEFLKTLSPPFFIVDDNKVLSCNSREWFSVELALLAVNFLYFQKGLSFNTPILLNQDTILELCSLCLADADVIMSMIDTASKTFQDLEMHKGEWGTSVILVEPVDISSVF
jgi:hypothetical protein